jgi:hypothetical protein
MKTLTPNAWEWWGLALILLALAMGFGIWWTGFDPAEAMRRLGPPD